jgi:hypothetical protein
MLFNARIHLPFLRFWTVWHFQETAKFNWLRTFISHDGGFVARVRCKCHNSTVWAKGVLIAWPGCNRAPRSKPLSKLCLMEMRSFYSIFPNLEFFMTTECSCKVSEAVYEQREYHVGVKSNWANFCDKTKTVSSNVLIYSLIMFCSYIANVSAPVWACIRAEYHCDTVLSIIIKN